MYNTSKYFIFILMLIERKTLYDSRVHSHNIPQHCAIHYAPPEKQAKELCSRSRGCMLGTCPPYRTQFFCFCIHFHQKCPHRRSMPPPMGACPPTGNPGSATGGGTPHLVFFCTPPLFNFFLVELRLCLLLENVKILLKWSLFAEI